MNLFDDMPPSFDPRKADQPSGDTCNWFTPLGYFLETERWLRELYLLREPFDCDPCGHPEAPVSREILSRGGLVHDFSGLSRAWGKRPFLNPPFDSETMRRFLECLKWKRGLGDVLEAAVHCPAWTDRWWWHTYIEPDRVAGRCTVRFEPGRMLYGYPGNPTGIGGDSAMFPSALVAWGPR